MFGGYLRWAISQELNSWNVFESQNLEIKATFPRKQRVTAYCFIIVRRLIKEVRYISQALLSFDEHALLCKEPGQETLDWWARGSLTLLSAWVLYSVLPSFCSWDKDKNGLMTSSNGNIFRVSGPLCGEFTGPGEFPTQRPVTRSFDVFFDLRLNKRLSKQPWGWWFETPSWSLWRHCYGEDHCSLAMVVR